MPVRQAPKKAHAVIMRICAGLKKVFRKATAWLRGKGTRIIVTVVILLMAACLVLGLRWATTGSGIVLVFVVLLVIPLGVTAACVVLNKKTRKFLLGRKPQVRSATYLKVATGTVVILTALVAVFGVLRTIEINSSDHDDSLLNTRYQDAAAALGDPDAAVRASAALALATLADEWIDIAARTTNNSDKDKAQAQAQLAIDTIITYLRKPIPLADGTVPARPVLNPKDGYNDDVTDVDETNADDAVNVNETAPERDLADVRSESILLEWKSRWGGTESEWAAWADAWRKALAEGSAVPDWMEKWSIEPDPFRPGQVRIRNLFDPSELDQGEVAVRDSIVLILKEHLIGQCDRREGGDMNVLVQGSWSGYILTLEKAYLPDLDLSMSASPDGYRGDTSFKCVTIGGTPMNKEIGPLIGFSLTEITVYGGISLDSAFVGRGIILNSASVGGLIAMDSAFVGRGISLDSAYVGGGILMMDVSVGGGIVMEGASVGGFIIPQGASVARDIILKGAFVGAGIILVDASVGGDIVMEGASVGGLGYVSLGGATVGGRIQLLNATFNGDLELGYASFMDTGTGPDRPITWLDYTDADGTLFSNRTTEKELGEPILDGDGKDISARLAPGKVLRVSPTCQPRNDTADYVTIPDLLKTC
jgi:hypothetical protein